MTGFTTPTYSYTLPVEKSLIKSIRLSFKQNEDEEPILVKENDELMICDKTMSVKLTQEETGKFASGIVKMQIHILTIGGDSLMSKVMTDHNEEALNKKVLE